MLVSLGSLFTFTTFIVNTLQWQYSVISEYLMYVSSILSVKFVLLCILCVREGERILMF